MKCSGRKSDTTERIVCTSRDVCMSDDNAIVIINGVHPGRGSACTEKRRHREGGRGGRRIGGHSPKTDSRRTIYDSPRQDEARQTTVCATEKVFFISMKRDSHCRGRYFRTVLSARYGVFSLRIVPSGMPHMHEAFISECAHSSGITFLPFRLIRVFTALTNSGSQGSLWSTS